MPDKTSGTGMRLLVVTNMYPTPDRPYFGIFVERQVEALRRAGLDIALEVVSADRGEVDYLLGRGRVRRAVRSFRPELIHCHYGYTPLAAAFTGQRYVVTLCGDDLNGQSNGRGGITPKSRAGVLVTQLFALAARRVIVRSDAMRRRLWPAARRKAETLSNGVDLGMFSPGSRIEARRRLGLPAEGLVLGFVNSIQQPTKRLDLAESVRDTLAARGVSSRLLVAEATPAAEMPWFYRAADCLLMTSEREGAPNCVKEALACGTPVIGVPVGDLPEVMTDSAMGRVTESDADRLADAVLSLEPSSDTRPSLLPARFGQPAVIERLLAIYERARGGL